MLELESIAATRFLFGIGVGLLASRYLSLPKRRRLGWALAVLGALSTPPFIYDIYTNRIQD